MNSKFPGTDVKQFLLNMFFWRKMLNEIFLGKKLLININIKRRRDVQIYNRNYHVFFSKIVWRMNFVDYRIIWLKDIIVQLNPIKLERQLTNLHTWSILQVHAMQIWFYTGFVARFTRRVPLTVQEPLTFPEHLCLPPVFLVGLLLIDL